MNSFHFREGGVQTSSPLHTSYLRFWLARNARSYTSARSIGYCAIWVCISSSSKLIHEQLLIYRGLGVFFFLLSTHNSLKDFDLRATGARKLLPVALASVSFGCVLVQFPCVRLRKIIMQQTLTSYSLSVFFELELELIQTQMTQKPVLRAEVYACALRACQNRK